MSLKNGGFSSRPPATLSYSLKFELAGRIGVTLTSPVSGRKVCKFYHPVGCRYCTVQVESETVTHCYGATG